MLRQILAFAVVLSLVTAPLHVVRADHGDETTKEETTKKEAQATKWAHIVVKGAYKEGPQLPGIFGAVTESLGKALDRLEKAAEDDDVSGLVLDIESVPVGWAKLNELRSGIERVRDAGKPVYAYMDAADAKSYLLAAACDKVFIPESGLIMIVGLRAEVGFYKNLFDKVGIEANMLRVGEYKSAAEPYSRTEMSPQFREELGAVIDGYYEIMVQAVAEGRGLKPAQVEKLIDEGPHTSKAAREQGLVDDLLYEDELVARIESDHPGTKVTLVKKYGKKKIDTDFSGFAGLAKFMNLMMGIDESAKSSKNPKIAVVYARGVIMPGSSSSDGFAGDVMGSTTMVQAVQKAAKDETVKAIVLRVDSPGGSALASDLIWRALEEADKPVVVSMGDTAASGGYYISMGADTIFAEPGTLTGSIGVVGGKLALGGMWDKLGINTSVVARGKNSGILSTTTGFTPSEEKAMQTLLNDVYEQFTTKAAKGRDMPYDKLEKLARGRIYTGRQALDVGLVDELGTLEDAVAHARKLAGLKEDDEVDRLSLPKPKSPFESLFGDLEVGASHDAGGSTRSGVVARELEALSPELAAHLRAARLVEMLSRRDPRLVVVPFRLDVR